MHRLILTLVPVLLGTSILAEDAPFELRHDLKAGRWESLMKGKLCVVILNSDAVMVNGKRRDIEDPLGRSKEFRDLCEKAIVIGAKSGDECDAFRKEFKARDDVLIFNEDGDLYALLPVLQSDAASGDGLMTLGTTLARRIQECLPNTAMKEVEERWRKGLDKNAAWEQLWKQHSDAKAFHRMEALIKPIAIQNALSPAAAEHHRLYGYLLRSEDVEGRDTDKLLSEGEALLVDCPAHPHAKAVVNALLELQLPLKDTLAHLRACARGAVANQRQYVALADYIAECTGEQAPERTRREILADPGPGRTGRDALWEAEAAEKASDFKKAVTLYEEAVKAGDAEVKGAGETALKRLKGDARVIEKDAQARMKLAANFLLNNAKEQAQNIFEEVIRKYPGTPSAAEAARKLEAMKVPAGDGAQR